MHDQTSSLREKPSAAVRASRAAVWLCRGLGRPLAIAIAAGAFLGFAGPFGMASAPLHTRLFYWIVVLTFGTLVGATLSKVADRHGWMEDRPWTEGIALTAALTIGLTGVSWLLTRALFGRGSPGSPFDIVLPVFLVCAAMVALNALANRTPAETHAALAGAPAPKFLERLPPKLRGADLYAVEAEDHYLRLHTSRGSDLILMRLSDAVAELEGLEGAQTHRSWWVAKDGFIDARKSDGRAVLALKSGPEAPVSRTYAKALREAGWF